jgi:transcriptional regulator with XRE-family HTH domain
MTTSVNAQRPLTTKINDLRQRAGMRYADLARESDEVRSTAWFNKLVNGTSPWVVSPPSNDTLDGFAELLNATVDDVRAWIAEEWYGVVPSELSARVRGLATRVDALSPQDYRLVDALLDRLSAPSDG